MKINTVLLLSFLSLGLSACILKPKVGGSCSYSQAVENAKVTAINPNYSVLSSNGLDYHVPISLFALAPKIGNEYTITFDKIIKGSCTPIVIKAVELIA